MRELEPQESKLHAYIQQRGIPAEHLIFETSCHTAAEAAHSAGATLEDLVKNVCLVTDTGIFAVAIVKGEDRVDDKRVAALLDSKKAKHATAEAVLAHTGYAVGGVPSFGYEAPILIDERVMEKPWVLTGGGSDRSLVRIAPETLVEASGGRVVVVRKITKE
jgi:prolyl-tRNA editing enzyme YbaK/EbsC (Cys-tRNA(Pro) deacylase)